jgi:excisionase family DNA binding protein
MLGFHKLSVSFGRQEYLAKTGGLDMPQIMTTKEVAKYLKLHEITICKYAAVGKIPAIRIGRVWRFDKEAIDKWISNNQEIKRQE